MGETPAFLSLCKRFCSADHGFELRAEQTARSAAAASSTARREAGREQAYPTWNPFQPLNHLLPGPMAGFRFCCRADLRSQDCTIMRAEQALHFRDVCMLRRPRKRKLGQQTCESLLCTPILLASFSSLAYFYLLCPALFGNSSNCHLR